MDMGYIIKVKFIVKLLGMGLGMEIMPCPVGACF